MKMDSYIETSSLKIVHQDSALFIDSPVLRRPSRHIYTSYVISSFKKHTYEVLHKYPHIAVEF